VTTAKLIFAAAIAIAIFESLSCGFVCYQTTLHSLFHHSAAAWKRSMEPYDILMLTVLVGAALFGAIKGFAWQLASIASILISYFVAYRFREPFSQSIQADPPWNRFLAMLILYVGSALIVWVLFRMASGTIDRMRLREFDRHIGFLFGLAKGGLYCILITMFVVTLMGERIREKVVHSRSGYYIAEVLDRSQAVIPPEIHQIVQPYLQRFDERFHEIRNQPWPPTSQAQQPPPWNTYQR
jgi:membrane protein required for colicin V production